MSSRTCSERLLGARLQLRRSLRNGTTDGSIQRLRVGLTKPIQLMRLADGVVVVEGVVDHALLPMRFGEQLAINEHGGASRNFASQVPPDPRRIAADG
jgi:hypothetical protein